MQQSRRGRARSEAARAAILRATRDELMASGYDKLSIDRIAAAAGAGKQTVYRWYPAKAALVADCILGGYVLAGIGEVPDTGDVRRDLRDWLRAFAEYGGEPRAAMLIRAAAAAAAESDEVATKLYEHVTSVTEAALTDRLRAAEQAGQLRAGSPAALLLPQALIGAVLYRLLTRLPLTADFADDLINSIYDSIQPPTAPADPALRCVTPSRGADSMLVQINRPESDEPRTTSPDSRSGVASRRHPVAGQPASAWSAAQHAS